MSLGHYKLEDGKPIACEDLIEWARWFEAADRQVARDQVGVVRVSTVFLGLDHNFGAGDPVLWETMVFGGPLDQEQDRYSSLDAAKEGHMQMVARVRAAASAAVN